MSCSFYESPITFSTKANSAEKIFPDMRASRIGSLTVKILWVAQHISILQNVSIGNICTASWYANTWLNHPTLKTKLTAEFSSLRVRAVCGLHLEETCHTQDSNNTLTEWVSLLSEALRILEVYWNYNDNHIHWLRYCLKHLIVRKKTIAQFIAP